MIGKLTIYLVRHGEVHHPAGIIHGRLPGCRLRAPGRRAAAGQRWGAAGPASPRYEIRLGRGATPAVQLVHPVPAAG
ncbi:MAG: hypothetical protein ABIL09_25065 [Gemmatimonadota bacterium]